LNLIAITVSINPTTSDPVSPMKILYFPSDMLNQRKTTSDPVRAAEAMANPVSPESQNQIPNAVPATIPTAAARPSIPSIRLNEFIIITIRNIVSRKEN
jgi:hypothetical protein